MQTKKSDIGKLCVIEYDDIGRVDALLLDKNELGFQQVYVFALKLVDTIDADQIIEIGDIITPR